MTREFRALRTKDFKFSPNLFLLSLSPLHPSPYMASPPCLVPRPPPLYRPVIFIVNCSLRPTHQLSSSYRSELIWNWSIVISLSRLYFEISNTSFEEILASRIIYAVIRCFPVYRGRRIGRLIGFWAIRFIVRVEARRDRPKEENRFVGRLDRTYVRTYVSLGMRFRGYRVPRYLLHDDQPT